MTLPWNRARLRRAAERIEPARSEVDYRFSIRQPDLNGIAVELEAFYVDTWGELPEDCLIRTGDMKPFEDEYFETLAGAIRLPGLFASDHKLSCRRFGPGLWDLGADKRFSGTLIYVNRLLLEPYGHNGNAVIALGPRAGVRAFVDWLEEQTTKSKLVKRNLTWDDAMIPSVLAAEIRQEVEDFLHGRSVYRSIGLPWKKGVLFSGPPGNGKTHTIRALASIYNLEVTSFVGPRAIAEFCEDDLEREDSTGEPRVHLVVFEDVDRAFSEGRSGASSSEISRFLNALDGLDEHDGCLVIATANEAEWLDPAIRSRPSRFDRIFEFPSPDGATRHRFLVQMLSRTGWNVDDLIELTEGFSLAFLKELCVGCLQHIRRAGAPDLETATTIAHRLRRHMRGTGRRMVGLTRTD